MGHGVRVSRGRLGYRRDLLCLTARKMKWTPKTGQPDKVYFPRWRSNISGVIPREARSLVARWQDMHAPGQAQAQHRLSPGIKQPESQQLSKQVGRSTEAGPIRAYDPLIAAPGRVGPMPYSLMRHLWHHREIASYGMAHRECRCDRTRCVLPLDVSPHVVGSLEWKACSLRRRRGLRGTPGRL